MRQTLRHAKMVANGLTTYKLISSVMGTADLVTERAAAQDSVMRFFSNQVKLHGFGAGTLLDHRSTYNR